MGRRPKWPDQGALAAWLGGQDGAVVGPPALGMNDSYERAGSLGRGDSGASGWRQTQAGQQYPQFRGHGSGPPICCDGKAPGNWGGRGELEFAAVSCTTQMHGVLAPRKELLAPTTPYVWTAAHLWVFPRTRSGQHPSFVLCIQDGPLRWQ